MIFTGGHILISGTTWTDILEIPLTTGPWLFTLEVDNDSGGGSAIAGFKTQLKYHEDDGDWHDHIIDSQWSSGIDTLASGSKAGTSFVIEEAVAMKFLAKAGIGADINVLVRGAYRGLQ